MIKRGIVTALSDNLWESYLLFHASLMRHNSYQLIVVDLGLSDAMASFVLQQPNTILVSNDSDLLGIDVDWRKWYKPLFFQRGIQAAGLEQALWLDVDIIISGPLDAMFEQIDVDFFVLPDYFAPEYCPNNPELYDVLMLQRPTDQRVINSGVIGVDTIRDHNLIEQWLANVMMAHNHDAIRELVTLHDQGTLLLAIHQIGHPGNIIDNKSWNFPARRLFYSDDRDLIDSVVNDHAGILIIHYMGWPKLPTLVSVNHTDTIVAAKQKFGEFETTNVVVSGFDNLLVPIAKALREQPIYGGLCHYSNSLSFPKQIVNRYKGLPVTVDYTPRRDWPFSYTFSPYLGPLFKNITDGKLWHIVVLGDPVEYMVNKLLTFQIWPQFLPLFPEFYQNDYNMVVNRSLAYRNECRLAVGDNLIDLCLNELTWMVGESLATGTVVFVKSITDAVDKLAIIGPWRMFTTNPTDIVQTALPHSRETKIWAREFADSFRDQIITTFFKLLYKYKVKIPIIIL